MHRKTIKIPLTLLLLSGCNDEFVIPPQWADPAERQRGEVRMIIDPYYPGIPKSTAVLRSDVREVKASVANGEGRPVPSSQILLDIQSEQARLAKEVRANNNMLNDYKKELLSEYEDLLQGLKQLATQQTQSPNGPVYVNTFSIAGPQNPIAPFVTPAEISNKISSTPANESGATEKLTEALLEHKKALVVYLDKLQTVIESQHSERINALKERLVIIAETAPVADVVQSVTRDVNTVVADINNSAKGSEKSGTEVWIDVSQVNNKDQRKRILRLMGEERKRKHHSAATPEKAEISQVLSITVHRRSRHSRLRIYQDSAAHQIKVVGICKSHSKAPFMFAFSCEDESRTIALLTEDTRKNKLVNAVLKVTCHSKTFAKYLATNPTARDDRCFLSRWSDLAASAGLSDVLLSHTDSEGKKAFEMLRKGEGCFATNELDIDIDCLRRRSKK